MRGLIHMMGLGTDVARLNAVRRTLDDLWAVFDTDGNGTIDENEFSQAGGLSDAIIAAILVF